MGQNGIPLFKFFFKSINKKVFFGGIKVPFRNGTLMPAAHFYWYRNGINIPSLRSRGGKGARYSCYIGKGVWETDTVATMAYVNRKQKHLL